MPYACGPMLAHMVRRLYIPLPQPTLDQLEQLARRELRRNAQDQAAYMIVRGLRDAGLVPEQARHGVDPRSR